MMALDDVVSSTLDPVKDAERIKEATDRTLRWIDRCISAHRNPQRQNPSLFGWSTFCFRAFRHPRILCIRAVARGISSVSCRATWIRSPEVYENTL